MSRPRCDAEVGSVKRGWHGCGRAAQFKVLSWWSLPRPPFRSVSSLLYCGRHVKRAHDPNERPAAVTRREVAAL